ncbi:hypothetical protein COCNU_02G005760 [Cocos nucifera]|uniref:Uncharacterized protein n=1 Tax=Cocos nucifera TaxID=13894 RepID=A0A8K0HYH9_COCNU|nr:hypothetical protein COCNU_02G005760 [Cocos nucifera]
MLWASRRSRSATAMERRRAGRVGQAAEVVASSDGSPFRVSTIPRFGTSRRGGEGRAMAAFNGPHSIIQRLEAGDYATGQAAVEGRSDG